MDPVLAYRRPEGLEVCPCGASVAGLTAGECCRGCARLVAAGQWEKLGNADRRWLMTLKDGLVWLTFGHGVMWVMTITLCGMRDYLENWPDMPFAWLPDLALAVGCWLVATRDATERGSWRAMITLALRVAAVGYFLNSVCTRLWESAVASEQGLSYSAWQHDQWVFGVWWSVLALLLAIRSGLLVRRMTVHSLAAATAMFALMTTAGTMMLNAAYLLDPHDLPDCLYRIPDVMQSYGYWPDTVGRCGLLVMALVYWGYLNLALARIEEVRGVTYQGGRFQRAIVRRKSLRGKLTA